jgi:hypothetical protein
VPEGQSNNAEVVAAASHSTPAEQQAQLAETDSNALAYSPRNEVSPVKESESGGSNRLETLGTPNAASSLNDGNAANGLFTLASVADENQMSQVTDVAAPSLFPQAADLIIPLAPLDVETVQAAIQDVMQKLDHLSYVMASSPEALLVSFWVLCAASTAAGCEIVRRRIRRHAQPLCETSQDDPLFTWIPKDGESTLEYGK